MNRKKVIENTLSWLIIIFSLTFILIPIVWLIIQSLVPRGFILNPSFRTFKEISLSNYAVVLDPSTSEFYRNIKNSIVISVVSTAITTLFGTLSGYAFGKFKFRGDSNLKTWILSMRFFPPISIVVPLYILWGKLHLADTIPGMILIYVCMNLPFSVWLMSSFFQDLPAVIEEAALVDGCSQLQAFRRITLPLAKGGIAVTSLFTFIFCWNEFIFALALTASRAATVTRALSGMVMMYGGIKWGEMTAAGVVLIIPILVATIILQKHIVRGLTFGAIKA